MSIKVFSPQELKFCDLQAAKQALLAHGISPATANNVVCAIVASDRALCVLMDKHVPAHAANEAVQKALLELRKKVCRLPGQKFLCRQV